MVIFSLSYYLLTGIILSTFVLGIFLYLYISAQKQKYNQLIFEKNMMYEKEREISLHLIKIQHENNSLSESKKITEEELNQKKWEEKDLQKTFFDKTQQLFTAQNEFSQEKKRIQEKEDKKNEIQLSEYSRQWNEHEQKVISLLKSFCISQLSPFTFYENTTLPSCFDGSIKPDFCIAYGEKYIVFDAKKSKNIKTYIQEQAKQTAEKYKEIKNISKQIFFIVPNEDFPTLQKTIYSFFGFSITVIPLSGIENTLALLNKMQALETLSEINPEEREQIIHCIMQYQNHISVQNSVNILMAEQSFDLQKSIHSLPDDFESKISQPQNSSLPFSLQKVKSLAQNYGNQEKKIIEMKTPLLSKV